MAGWVSRVWRGAVTAGAVCAGVLTVHAAVNSRLWRVPSHVGAVPGEEDTQHVSAQTGTLQAGPVQAGQVQASAQTGSVQAGPQGERVSICVPMRNEAANVSGCLSSIARAGRSLTDWELLVVDDASEDATAGEVSRFAEQHPEVPLRVVSGCPRPEGWLGKPWACAQLADAASGAVLVFVDADVRLEPVALSAAVRQLRDVGLDVVSPYPRQVAVTWAERLIQPLLQWTFLTTLPLRVAERGRFESMVAANGQFLVIDAAAYHRAGGHRAIRDAVLDDVELLRQVVHSGGRGVVTNGTHLAHCRMYTNVAQVRDGYGKSLWCAFGTPTAGLIVAGFLTITYVLPALAAVNGSRVGVLGYAAGVGGRVVVAHTAGQRMWPDVLAHPLSVSGLVWLIVDSQRRYRRGELSWRGRPVVVSNGR